MFCVWYDAVNKGTVTSVGFLPLMYNLNLMRKYQTNPHGGTFHKITGRCYSDVLR